MSSSPPKNPDQKQPRLLDRALAVVRARPYSIRTERTFVQSIRRYIRFHNKRHPIEMGSQEINGFLSQLALQNVATFPYKTVLHKNPGELEDVIFARKPKKLPHVLHTEKSRWFWAHLKKGGNQKGLCEL